MTSPPFSRIPGRAAPGSTAGLLILIAAAVLSLALPHGVEAQYFGRNKVQYEDFDFRVLRTEHFDIHHYERESAAVVEDFGRMAERWYERFARTFQYALGGKKPLLVYANKADFQQTNAIPGFLSQGTGGVTESIKDRVIMPLAGTYGETDHVLGHELVHAFQFDLAKAQSGGGATGFVNAPLWFVEGMAEYLSLGREYPQTAMWMRDAVLNDRVPTIREMSQSNEYFPYRFGHALWAFIAGNYGDIAVTELFRAVGERGMEGGFQQVLGTPPDSLSDPWISTIQSYYRPFLEGRTPPEEVGRRILGGEMNLAPTLSPDGRRIAFFSQKDVFTIDLFLADARTGETLGKLASASRNPHFDALFFLSSAGAWSPDGTRFAFVTFAEGDNQIAIASVDDREVTRNLSLSGIGAVFALDWSPDGSTIVLSGSSGGMTDLFLADLETGSVERLTNDPFAELHPAWSPDGGTVAFATDRGAGADLELLTFPSLGLGFLDRSSGRIEVERPLGSAKHINPRWSPNGRSLYFISDREGFSDVYRLELSSGDVRQITRVATGVTGISEDSPALSVASQDGSLAFTLFDNGDYVCHVLSPEEAEGRQVDPVAGRPLAGFLPPVSPGPDGTMVSAYLEDPRTGLPSARAFEAVDYGAGLQLDYLAQPAVGVAVDRFGTGLGGSIAAFFSDMLGNHQLGVGLQAQGRLEDIGGQVAYMNLGNRMNWGARAGRIPYRTGFTQSGTTTVDGDDVQYVDLAIARTILYRGVSALEYPFSSTTRIEAEAGVSHLTFDREVTRSYFSPGGVFLGREDISPSQVGLVAPEALTLYHGSLAYVGDFSFFGFTSPVRGGRYRIEAEGNGGDLTFANILGDYRRYFFQNPLTVAVRALHIGRYGPDAESDRLSPFFLGNEVFVRGYGVGSFRGSECTRIEGEEGSCPEFDRLVGSRIAVANLELRIPLLGTERFGLIEVGFLPTELSLFADGGVAWTESTDPDLRFSTDATGRIPVFSAGASARFNVLGRLVIEAYWAYPFQRDRSGLFGFNLAPGW